ncbi:unnamed protein product [Victoria cruziana]
MSTQRLDFSCSFPRFEVPIPQPARPAGFSVLDRPQFEGKANCSLKRSSCIPSAIAAQTAIWVPSERWEKRKNLKRLCEQSSSEESCVNRSKRIKESSPECTDDGEFSADILSGVDFYFSEPIKPESVVGIPISFSTPSTAEDVHFAPSSVVSLLPNATWVESVVTEISDRGDYKDEVATSENPKSSNSNSSSSETQSSTQQGEESSEKGTGNGSELPCQSEGTEIGNENISTGQGLELVNLLVSCTEAISCKNFALVNHYLSKLGELASPEGTPIHRVAAYFTEAMALRVAKLWPHIFKISPRELDPAEEDQLTSFRLLNEVSPIPKFLQFTANEMILRAFEGKDRVHIIDLDIKHGLQWPSLFQSLVSRPNPPSHVRITGVGESKQELQDTGDRLAGFAEALSLPFEFHAVVDKLEDLRLWMLHVKENESVAVNCMLQLHRVLNDSNGSSLRDFLGLIQSVRPTVLVISEQESSHNDPSWEERFCNSLNYYSAVFDSLDSGLPPDSPARIRIEEMFAREIRNIIACEGTERTERHENFDRWKRIMEGGGFRCLGVSERETMQSNVLLKMFSCENYKMVKQGDEGLTLCWAEHPLFTVSTWASSMEVAGTSSSFSQPG